MAAAAARRGVVPFATIVTRRVSYTFSHGGRAFRLDLDEAAFPDAPLPALAAGGAPDGNTSPATAAAAAAVTCTVTDTAVPSPSRPPTSPTNGKAAYVYAVGELETLVATPADVAAATADLAAVAAARGISVPAAGAGGAPLGSPPAPRGKLATLLAATAPAHYAALVAAGVLPS